jgi:alpha-L-fucosidase
MLIDTVSKGGNLLLNVGPTARGTFDGRALDRLAGMGKWMHAHGRAIYGCGPAPKDLRTPQDCRLTYNAETRRLYVHVFAWPFGALHLDGMAGKVKYAQLLNDASEIPMRDAGHLAHWGVPEGTLILGLPVQRPDVTVPVIELFLE